MAFARRAASALRVGDELVEADGCLLTVAFAYQEGREVVLHIAACGMSHPRLLRVRASQLFSVAVDRDAAVAA